jgi:hypothetical protein
MTCTHRNDPDIDKLKRIVSARNKVNKDQKRVLLRGRVPVDGSKYTWGGNIQGGLDNATRFDVYVYERYAR